MIWIAVNNSRSKSRRPRYEYKEEKAIKEEFWNFLSKKKWVEKIQNNE